jgi:iron complex outermembrane receptor protein
MKYHLFLVVIFLAISIYAGNEDLVHEKINVTGKVQSQPFLSRNIEIITAEDIEKIGITSFSELFSHLSMINVSRRGPMDSSFDLNMRGSNFEQILVLVNGVPLNNSQTGHFNTDFPFSIQNIAQIEVVKGGNSAAYGNGAFAGVINIVLKEKLANQIQLTGGEHGFYLAGFQAGHSLGKFQGQIHVARQNTAGFHPGTELDQFTVTNRVSWQDPLLDGEIHFGYVKKDFGAANFYGAYPSLEITSGSMFLVKLLKKVKTIDTQLSYSLSTHDDEFTLDRYRPEFFMNSSQTQCHLINLSAMVKTGRFQLNSGTSLKTDAMQSTNMGDQQRTAPAFFCNISYEIANGCLDVGLRHEFNQSASHGFTWYLGSFFKFSPQIDWRGAVSKAVRLPSFTELFYRSPSNCGDDSLIPESSLNLETNLNVNLDVHRLGLSVFYRQQQHMLDWIWKTDQNLWQAMNLDFHHIAGTEISYIWQNSQTTVSSSLEKIVVLNQQRDVVSKYGLNFPDLVFRLGLQQTIAAVQIKTSYLFKHIFQSRQAGHFVNLNFSKKIAFLRLDLTCDNIFNTIIEEIPNIKIPGRWVYLGCTCQF